MSHCSWHNYGYGICTDDLEISDVEKIKALIQLAPEYEKKVMQLFADQGITNTTVDDYLDLDVDYSCGIATILANVIHEAEGIWFTACSDYNCAAYLIYQPSYPWEMKESEQNLTEEAIRLILVKYTSIISDTILTIDYCSVENGG